MTQVVRIEVPDALAQELGQIAKEQGYVSAKQMVIAYLKDTIRTRRAQEAAVQARDQVEEELGGID